ncbi:DNA gyrase inhibitor YacG [Sulfitobacter geojensis]|uniref:DNA gyrase inhibitor YacG n=1 Tax=Sulfitobacter geojensis TaxID=1342299 RepID=UPI0007D9A2D6|nr:DNA gyrase inhibitor YacG [Sulfitobacter geojensis]OAN85779.1 DNA gyrase inhibitor [Sulfitobacter geojensis]
MSCPMCKAEADPKYRPFCSGRCADLDLAKWLNGSYATPSRDPEDMDAAIDAAEAALNAPQKPH